jgi:hypothetical protein
MLSTHYPSLKIKVEERIDQWLFESVIESKTN